jgi:SAM-dependent methyltransferase
VVVVPPQGGRSVITTERVACSLCGSTAVGRRLTGCGDRLYSVPGTFDVCECAGCGLARTDPRPTREVIGAFYPPAYLPFASTPDADSAAVRLRRRVAALIRTASFAAYRAFRRPPPRMPRPPLGRARLLDIGAGSGGYVQAMRALGWEPSAIEPDPGAAAAIGDALGDQALVHADAAEAADFPPGSFDLITMSHVIEHLHDPREVLQKVRGWLAPAGQLHIRCPNYRSLERRVFGRYWFGLDVPRHLWHFSPQTLSALLHETGFVVDRIAAEEQTATLAGSLNVVRHAVRGGRAAGSPSSSLQVAATPLAGLQFLLGQRPTMVVVARAGEA